MLSRQSIWFQVAVALVTAFLIWFLCSERVEAGVIGSEVHTINGQEFTYYYLDSFDYYFKSTKFTGYPEYSFSVPVYAFFYKVSSSSYTNILFVSDSYFDITLTNYNTSGVASSVSNYSSSYRSDYGVYSWGSSFTPTSFDYVVNSTNVGLESDILSYFASDSFVEIKKPIEAIWLQGQKDNNFSLLGPYGLIEDNVFHAYWGFPVRSELEEYENMPLRVKFAVEDTDSGTVSTFFYPTNSLDRFNSATPATYSVKDYSLEIPLADLGEKLPANYRIQYVELYPYYFVDDVISQENLRVGLKSVIKLNYDGTYNGTVEVLPDDSYQPEDVDTSILGMISNFFSGFFNNFKNLLKDAFIPSKEDMETLLLEMNDWFSERFGFIWYPFDLAIQVVSAFTMGEADSVIEIPAVTLNMLGGVTLWESFTVDFDTMGIFEYVRFFTSAILACSIADLAIIKWREWIGGKDA